MEKAHPKPEYTVEWIRSQGVECKMSRKRKGKILGYVHHTGDWALITDRAMKRAEEVGMKQAFEEATVFIGFFSVPL